MTTGKDEFDISDISPISNLYQQNLTKLENYKESGFIHSQNVVDIDSDSDFGMTSSIGSSVLLGTLNQEIIESITKLLICLSLENSLEKHSKENTYIIVYYKLKLLSVFFLSLCYPIHPLL